MYKLEFYVPESHLEEVKNAVFDAGAGRIGDYDSCCWESAGTGQFRGTDASEPFIGKPGNIERIKEIKVEMVCSDEKIREAVKALIKNHPYQVPAFQYWKVNGILD